MPWYSFLSCLFERFNAMSGKKKKRKIYSEAARRRKKAVFAWIRAFLMVLVAGGAVFGIIQFNRSIEIPLAVSSENYHMLSNNSGFSANGGEDDVWEDSGQEAEDAFADQSLLKYRIPQPKLRGEYPIDMVIRSEYAIVYDVQADEVLYAKNAEQKCYPASTTKILTASVMLDNVPEDFMFTAGDELDFVNPESSLAFINKGNVLSREMITDALMLPSGNDAAYTVAANVGKYIAGNDDISPEAAVKAFVDEMNRTARYIGTENTHFSDPDGFHDDDHYTTVLDMLKVTLYGMKKPELMASAGKPSAYAVFETGEEVSWENSNKLIQEYSDCYYMYANGMKTGMTDQSGYCVVATARRFDHDVVCLVFGASASDIRWNDTIALLDAAFVEIRSREGV